MRKINIAFLTLLLVTVMVSCSKSDEYKKYLENGETFYTGKLDSVKIYSGRNRVKVTGLLPADPKITRCRITWNDGKDSAVYPISKGVGVDSFSQIINVSEGVVSFRIRTFDAAGNGSLVVNAIGTAYGVKYESGLVNRPVVSADIPASGNGKALWGTLDTTSGVLGTMVTYTRTTNATDSVFTPIRQSVTTLTGSKTGTVISYRTVYKPMPTAIDSFYSAYATLSDITSTYLSNTGPGFLSATLSGRWGTLAAPWVTTTAAKNKSGTNGGFSSDAGGVINWETYSNTPVTNGIVYQATSAALPAGRYILSFDEYSELLSNSTVYCVAATGNTGIPILANLSTALGSTALYNSAIAGTASSYVTDTRSLTFTISTPQVVSFGFLGNIAVNNYFTVKRIQLLKN